MPVLQFKGKTAVECYHHTVPLDGSLIIEGDNLLALKALLPTHAGRINASISSLPEAHSEAHAGSVCVK